jgi:hypothetical protein
MHTSALAIAYRSKVLALEAAMRQMPQVDIEIKHYFGAGMYIREMHVPAGVTLTGKIHRTEHVCVLSRGEVSVASPEGTRRIKAPAMVHSMPGAKRAIHAHADAVWANLHRTNVTDLDELEAQLIAPGFEHLED